MNTTLFNPAQIKNTSVYMKVQSAYYRMFMTLPPVVFLHYAQRLSQLPYDVAVQICYTVYDHTHEDAQDSLPELNDAETQELLLNLLADIQKADFELDGGYFFRFYKEAELETMSNGHSGETERLLVFYKNLMKTIYEPKPADEPVTHNLFCRLVNIGNFSRNGGRNNAALRSISVMPIALNAEPVRLFLEGDDAYLCDNLRLGRLLDIEYISDKKYGRIVENISYATQLPKML